MLLDYHLRVSFAAWRFNPDRLRRVRAAVRAASDPQVVPGAPAARVAAAEITLAGLVYFSTLGEGASLSRRVVGMLDRERLERWTREWLAG